MPARYAPILSLPSGVVALWAVGAGLYGVALFAAFFGGWALYVGSEAS